jgi:hypothetical protein
MLVLCTNEILESCDHPACTVSNVGWTVGTHMERSNTVDHIFEQAGQHAVLLFSLSQISNPQIKFFLA